MGEESEEPSALGRNIYDLENLPEEGKICVAQLRFAESKLEELTNQHALLTRAKNSYIDDLKRAIVRGRSGMDVRDLFSDD